MYTQFSATERDDLHKALDVLNKDVSSPEKYREALYSALSVLSSSLPNEGNRLMWAVEMLSAYRQIGKSLIERLSEARVNIDASFEKEFGDFLKAYQGNTSAERVSTLLTKLMKIDTVRDLSGYDKPTLVDSIDSALEHMSKVEEVMNSHDIPNEDELDGVLKQREKLLTESERFDDLISKL